MNDEEASRKAFLLQSFRALVANPAWTEEVAPKIARAKTEHLDACVAEFKSPAERAEHIHAYHLADELASFCAGRIAALERELKKHAADSNF